MLHAQLVGDATELGYGGGSAWASDAEKQNLQGLQRTINAYLTRWLPTYRTGSGKAQIAVDGIIGPETVAARSIVVADIRAHGLVAPKPRADAIDVADHAVLDTLAIAAASVARGVKNAMEPSTANVATSWHLSPTKTYILIGVGVLAVLGLGIAAARRLNR